MNNVTTTPRRFGQPCDLRTMPVGDRGLLVLAEHALSLPARHPVRTVIANLGRRFTEAAEYEPDAPVLTKEQAVEMLRNTKNGYDFQDVVCGALGIEDGDLDGTAELMEAA